MYNDTKKILDDFSDKLTFLILPYDDNIIPDWNISYSNNVQVIRCSNFYDHINKNGFYDAMIPFTVDILVKYPLGFNITINGNANRSLVRKEHIDMKLDYILSYAFDQHMKEFQNFAQILSSHAINLKEDIVMEGMKVLSENRFRSEKEIASIRNCLDKKLRIANGNLKYILWRSKDPDTFKTINKTSDDFIQEIKENAVKICNSLKIAPPIHSLDNSKKSNNLNNLKNLINGIFYR